MKTYFDFHFQKNLVVLYPGEFFSSNAQDEMISTVLGSCIAITLYDPKLRIGGMNHFMLVSSSQTQDAQENSGRFGEFAVELLLNDMMKKGAQKKRMIAKVFGGSNMFKAAPSEHNVGEQNIDFAFYYLERENIPIQASDVGGNYSRKVYFDPVTSKVWLKHVKEKPRAEDVLRKRESEYQARVLKQEEEKKKASNDIVWF